MNLFDMGKEMDSDENWGDSSLSIREWEFSGSKKIIKNIVIHSK